MSSPTIEIPNPTEAGIFSCAIEVLGCNAEIVATQELIRGADTAMMPRGQRGENEIDRQAERDGCTMNVPLSLSLGLTLPATHQEESEEIDISTTAEVIFRTKGEFGLTCISHRIFWRVPNSRIFSVPPTVRALGESAHADKFV